MKKENYDGNYLNIEVPPNITDVITRICLFCLFPCSYKKLGKFIRSENTKKKNLKSDSKIQKILKSI